MTSRKTQEHSHPEAFTLEALKLLQLKCLRFLEDCFDNPAKISRNKNKITLARWIIEHIHQVVKTIELTELEPKRREIERRIKELEEYILGKNLKPYTPPEP